MSATTATGTVDGATVEFNPEHVSDSLTRVAALPADDHSHAARTVAVQPSEQPGTTKAVTRTALPVRGPLGVPTIAVSAYQSAERTLAVQQPNCHMPWELLAGIGRVESHHANGGDVDADGTARSPIYGPALDGSLPGNEVIGDGSGGYQRAQGPMQFMPGTWARYAPRGANPQNLFDAALTAGRYLCTGGLDMDDTSQRTRAILRYNNSMAYVANVMAWSVGYRTGVIPASSALPRI